MPDFPNPEITGIARNRFDDEPPDWEAITDEWEYEDGSKDFNEVSDRVPRYFEEVYTGLSASEASIFDAFYNSVRFSVPFEYKDKYGNVWTNVYIAKGGYSRTHEEHRSWIKTVKFRLVNFDGVFTAPPIEMIFAEDTGSDGEFLSFTPERTTPFVAADIELVNCVRPENDIDVEFFRNAVSLGVITLPGHNNLMNQEADLQRDASRRYWKLFNQTLSAGDVVTAEIISGATENNMLVRAQLYSELPTDPLAMPEYLRPHRKSGAGSFDTFEASEIIIAEGNEILDDPQCATQNNSGIIWDEINQKFYAFVAFYSQDEQHGGSRFLAKSRIYGYRSIMTGSTITGWEEMGLIIDIDPGSTDQTQYAGDPQPFIGNDGKAYIAFDTCNGTNGFGDFTKISVKVIKADSFEDTWSAPVTLLPFEVSVTPNIGFCPRIVPRGSDYVLFVQEHDLYNNRRVKAYVISDLINELTVGEKAAGQIVIRNNGEGGNCFVKDDRVYLTEWQTPGLASNMSPQRVFSAPLATCHLPTAWTSENLNWYHMDAEDVRQDGGVTADAISGFYKDGSLYITIPAYSGTDNLNRILWAKQSWNSIFGDDLIINTPDDNNGFIVADIPIGVNAQCRYKFTPRLGTKCYLMYGQDQTDGSIFSNFQLTVDLRADGLYMFSSNAIGNESLNLLDGSVALAYANDTEYDLIFRKTGNVFSVHDGATDAEILSATITDEELLEKLTSDCWFKFAAHISGKIEMEEMTVTNT